MNKGLIFATCAALTLSGCGTYAGSGAFAGASLGSVLGSAIGGLGGGWRGSNVGTLVGMAAGAAVGGAVGSAADQKAEQQQRRDLTPEERQAVIDHYHQVQRDRTRGQGYQGDDGQGYTSPGYDDSVSPQPQGQDDSGYDPNDGGDDRLYDFNGSDYNGDYSAQQPTTTMPESSSVDGLADNYKYSPDIEIVNARFIDANHDNVISSNEVCKAIFEIMNRGSDIVYDVVPTVVEATGNKHISISPSVHVEKIEPGKGVRYTAIVKADNRIKDGSVKICVSVVQGNKAISKVSEFNIETRK